MIVKYQSFMKDVFTDIVKIEKETLKQAATHVRDKMKEKVSKKGRSLPGSPPGVRTGNLKKGIKFDIRDRDSALVGLGPPAHHGHLLEFGTLRRVTKKGKQLGRVLPRPFVRPTFEEESDTVRKIMEGQFTKV